MTNMTVNFVADIAIIQPNNKRIDAAFAANFRQDVTELKEKGYSKMIGKREHLILCNIHPNVLNVLQLTKMQHALILCDTEKLAIQALQD
jgi:anti-anti-sigma regulatory factor